MKADILDWKKSEKDKKMTLRKEKAKKEVKKEDKNRKSH